MATTAARRSSKSTNGSAHASQALKTLSREGKKISKELSRDSAALTRRAGELYNAAANATRRHPFIALGGVAALAALLGGAFWYRQR